MTTLREEISDLAQQIGEFAATRERILTDIDRDAAPRAYATYHATAGAYRRVEAWLNMVLVDYPARPVESIRPTRLYAGQRRGTDRVDQGAP